MKHAIGVLINRLERLKKLDTSDPVIALKIEDITETMQFLYIHDKNTKCCKTCYYFTKHKDFCENRNNPKDFVEETYFCTGYKKKK